MKKIKLLTPILGLTAITGVVAPVMTSCSGVGHVWLTSIDQQEKSGNASGITYYFGLNSELYETKDIDVQVVSDNKDEFDTEWSVSGSVLSVIVKYIGEIESGSTKKTTFKLRIKTVYWADEIELKGNFEGEATLIDWIERYKEISKTWLSIKTHPTTFKVAVGDYISEYDGTKTKTTIITDDMELTNSYFIEEEAITGHTYAGCRVAYKSEVLIGASILINQPEYLMNQYLEYIQQGADIKFYTPSDGSLAADIIFEIKNDSRKITNINRFAVDKNGYFKNCYLYSGVEVSGTIQLYKEQNFHFSDYE